MHHFALYVALQSAQNDGSKASLLSVQMNVMITWLDLTQHKKQNLW